MNKLLEKYAKSVLSFSIEYNPHKVFYYSVSEYIQNQELTEDDFPNEDMQLCIENDSVWYLHCYPKTPIGSYSIYGHDLEILLNIITSIPEIKYEISKRELQDLNLSTQEYEKRLKQLAKELGI